MKRTVTLALLGAAAALAFAGPAAAADKVLFNNFAPPKANPSAQVIVPWAEAINATGKVEMEIPSNSLAPPPRQMDIVTQGIADGAYIFNAFLQKRVPHVQLSLLPLTTTSAEADAVALWRTYQKFFKANDPYKDVVLLGFMAAPGAHLYSMQDTPIRSADDLKRMKMWSPPGYPALMLKNLGTAVVPGPAVRMYEIISKGTVDGYCGVDLSDVMAFKVDQFAKSITAVPGAVFSASFSVFLSKAKWAQLSQAGKDAILAESGEKIARLSKGWDGAVAKAETAFKAQGKQIVPAPPALTEALRKASQQFRDDWIADMKKEGVDGKAALEFFLSEAKKVAAGG